MGGRGYPKVPTPPPLGLVRMGGGGPRYIPPGQVRMGGGGVPQNTYPQPGQDVGYPKIPTPSHVRTVGGGTSRYLPTPSQPGSRWGRGTPRNLPQPGQQSERGSPRYLATPIQPGQDGERDTTSLPPVSSGWGYPKIPTPNQLRRWQVTESHNA